MNLIQHQPAHVQAVFGADLCGQHLIEAVVGVVDDALVGPQYLAAFEQRWGHLHHLRGYIEDNRSLLSVRRCAVHLSRGFTIAKEQVQRHSGSQLTLAVLLGYLDVGGGELAFPVGLERAENVPDNLFLPWQQIKGLSGPAALGMA